MVFAGWDFMKLEPMMMVDQVKAKSHLRTLVHVLEMFNVEEGGYPAEWLRDLYVRPRQNGYELYAPSEFDADIQSASHTVQGYRFRYTPKPIGCEQYDCTGYEISAVPDTDGSDQPDAISLFIDQTLIMRHCIGTSGAHSSDRPASKTPSAC